MIAGRQVLASKQTLAIKSCIYTCFLVRRHLAAVLIELYLPLVQSSVASAELKDKYSQSLGRCDRGAFFLCKVLEG